MATKYSRDYPQEALFGGLPGNFKFILPRINNKKKSCGTTTYIGSIISGSTQTFTINRRRREGGMG
jgi:hypothetical protein